VCFAAIAAFGEFLGLAELEEGGSDAVCRQGQCVSYGAKGGTLTAPVTTSISAYVARPQCRLRDPALRRLLGSSLLMHRTDANGAFDSGTEPGTWTGVYLACRDIPETAHVTASDGTHQASTDITFTTYP